MRESLADINIIIQLFKILSNDFVDCSTKILPDKILISSIIFTSLIPQETSY